MENKPDPAKRITDTFLRVLSLFVSHQDRQYCGYDIVNMLDMKTGTVYPLLHRLEKSGWLKCQAENIDPRAEGRPGKRLYSLSDSGLECGGKLLKKHLCSL
jgi:DNA-binding PadR family transcriptional regulator